MGRAGISGRAVRDLKEVSGNGRESLPESLVNSRRGNCTPQAVMISRSAGTPATSLSRQDGSRQIPQLNGDNLYRLNSRLNDLNIRNVLRSYIAGNPHQTLRVKFDKNRNIYNAGDQGERCMYLIESGQVKTVVFTRNGKRCILDVYGRNDVFGELCLLSGMRMETATAMEPTVLQSIPAGKVLDALSDSEFWRSFTRYLAHRLFDLQDTVVDFVTMESEIRLAARLLKLGRRLGQQHPKGRVIEARITQEELADMIGTTRSRVGYFLKRFRDIGLVEVDRGSRLIVNEHRLNSFLDELV